jgi:hypothetical protein
MPVTPEAHITDIRERYGCLFVTGKVYKGTGQWLTAKATIHKADVLHMSKQDFEAFILRRLPEMTIEDQDWDAMAAEARL